MKNYWLDKIKERKDREWLKQVCDDMFPNGVATGRDLSYEDSYDSCFGLDDASKKWNDASGYVDQSNIRKNKYHDLLELFGW